MDSILFWLVPAASVLALCFAYYFHKQMMKETITSGLTIFLLPLHIDPRTVRCQWPDE